MERLRLNQYSTNEELVALLETSNEKNSKRIKNELLKRNEKLIHWIVGAIYSKKSNRSKNVEYEDLFQEGSLGFLEALSAYNPARGAFSTAATLYSRKRIYRYLEKHSELIRPPANKIWIAHFLYKQIDVYGSIDAVPADKLREFLKKDIPDAKVDELKNYAKTVGPVASIEIALTTTGEVLGRTISDETRGWGELSPAEALALVAEEYSYRELCRIFKGSFEEAEILLGVKLKKGGDRANLFDGAAIQSREELVEDFKSKLESLGVDNEIFKLF